MNILEITHPQRKASEVIADLKRKNIIVPSWANLQKEYNQKLHPIYTDKHYRDKYLKSGRVEKQTRVSLGWQKLAVKRICEMMFGIPVKRIYNAQSEEEKKVSILLESIFKKNRINAINLERGKNLFASCENVTIWYSQEKETIYAGEKSKLRLRCKNFSPMQGSEIYPLFDEYDDLVALSIEYTRQENDTEVSYFDTYTETEHIRWRNENGIYEEELREFIELEKITGVYIHRPTPIWEDESDNVYEAEWTLSRNGNYIRKNARPTWVVFSDSGVQYGKSEGNDNAGRDILQYPKDAKAGYETWQQATESIKFHIEELKKNFFTDLQLPDMSMDNMKSTPMSGEARKMMFIDAQLKVLDESGAWIEIFEREINVVKAFMKKMFPTLISAIDSLEVTVEITPFQIRDDSEQITNLTNACGKPIMSHRTAIANLAWVDDVDKELDEITKSTIITD